MDQVAERDIQKLRDKIDADLKDSQRREEAMAKETAKREALYDTTVGIIQAEIEKLLAGNYRRIVNVVKQNETTRPYYNGLDDEKKVMLLVRATHKGASEFFQRYEPDFLRSSQENSQENGLHILLQLPKNMQ